MPESCPANVPVPVNLPAVRADGYGRAAALLLRLFTGLRQADDEQAVVLVTSGGFTGTGTFTGARGTSLLDGDWRPCTYKK